jgi:hypothetical protein
MTLNRKEISRYLGQKGAPLAPSVEALAAACQEELTRTASPRFLSRRLSLDPVPWDSRNLAHHLRHCREGYLYAVTLGAETDRLLRRWGAQSMAKAAVGQACCAVWLDDLCAKLCEELQTELHPGEYLTPPFSPGYGDWALSAQGEVLALLNAHKRIGLTLTAGGMMVPEKSVTAVVGVSDRKEEACGQKCMRCQKKDCPFRGSD